MHAADIEQCTHFSSLLFKDELKEEACYATRRKTRKETDAKVRSVVSSEKTGRIFLHLLSGAKLPISSVYFERGLT